jgi:hypothetical protein
MVETNTQTQPEAPKQAPKGSEVPPEPKWLYYVLSFFVSIVGIVLGIIYMKKDGEENKKFGKMCLILGIVPTALACLCWVIMMVFGVGTSFLGGGTEYSTY